VSRTLRVAPIERDYTDHRSIEIDDEIARATPGNFRHRPLEFVARARATEVGAHFRRAEQVDDSRTVPSLRLTKYQALRPERAWWPGDGSQMCHALILTTGPAVLPREVSGDAREANPERAEIPEGSW
jgi:hypothetical protein